MSAGDLGFDIGVSLLKGCFFVMMLLGASMALFGWIAWKMFPTVPFPMLVLIGTGVTLVLALIVSKIINR